MPATNKTRRSAQKPGKGFRKRKDRKKHGRKGGQRAKQGNPRVIANSVFALTLNAKPGLEVKTKLEKPIYGEEDDYHKMYKDLLAAFQNGMKLSGTPTYADPLKEGLQIGACLAYVVNGFKNNLLPGGYEMRIDKDDHYYFTAYIQCDFPAFWHAFELMPVVEYLKRYMPSRLELFLQFISFMRMRLGIPTWWNGGMGYAEYQMEEAIDQDMWEDNNGPLEVEPDSSPEEIRNAKLNKLGYEAIVDDFNSYSAGEVKEYENILCSCRVDPSSLESSIAKCRGKQPIITFMKEALKFMEEPGSLSDYVYHDLNQDEEYEGVDFDRQATIIWDWEDEYARLEMDAMDVDANNYGVISPVFHYRISKHTKKLDTSRFHENHTWPMRFSGLWKKYRDVVNGYRKKLKLIKPE